MILTWPASRPPHTALTRGGAASLSAIPRSTAALILVAAGVIKLFVSAAPFLQVLGLAEMLVGVWLVYRRGPGLANVVGSSGTKLWVFRCGSCL